MKIEVGRHPDLKEENRKGHLLRQISSHLEVLDGYVKTLEDLDMNPGKYEEGF